ncbi:MAG: DUF2059 domain-containing protein [Nibricoccus sp.]
MKMKLMIVALLAAGSAFAAELAPFQLKGVLNTGSEKLFGLSTQTGDHSAWVSLGKTFEGYKLKSFDDAKGVLLFEFEGKTYELSLASSKIVATDPAKGTPATIAEATKLIDQMRFEEMIAKSLEAQKRAMGQQMARMAQQGGAQVDPKEMEEHMGKVMDALAEAMNIPQMKKEMAQIYAETFTKQELTAMSDFQATPAGKAMIDKQPEIQEKLQNLMMPRIMSAMPKIQQMSMEFGRQQQEKAKAAAAATQPAQGAAPATK